MSTLFNLENAMLEQEYIEAANKFIAIVKEKRDQLPLASLKSYLPAIIKLG